MSEFTPEQLAEILRKNAAWRRGETGGERADLRGADLRGANLRGADLSSADLSSADLSGADLSDANLRGADLRGADLSSADLSSADLCWADLSGADLSGADLSDANLRDADLRGANLRGADLSSADLSSADLSGAAGPFSTFYGSVHHAWAAGGRAGIGCHLHTIEYWQENYREIGAKNDYTPEQIERYGAWIMSLDWLKLPKDGEA